MQSVRQRVDLLRSGCDTNRCCCKKNGTACGPGCRCKTIKHNRTAIKKVMIWNLESWNQCEDRTNNEEEQDVTDSEDDNQNGEFYMDLDGTESMEDFEQ